MTPTPESNPFGLTPEQRQVFGEYVMRQRGKERTELSMQELDAVIDTIKIAMEVEREDCAAVAESFRDRSISEHHKWAANEIAAAIRARKDKP